MTSCQPLIAFCHFHLKDAIDKMGDDVRRPTILRVMCPVIYQWLLRFRIYYTLNLLKNKHVTYGISYKLSAQRSCFVFVFNYIINFSGFLWSVLPIILACCTGTVGIVWLPQCHWSNPERSEYYRSVYDQNCIPESTNHYKHFEKHCNALHINCLEIFR